ncbi:MAG: SGNH/GDSL hydrolase family protein, partial [Longicatena sp.]
MATYKITIDDGEPVFADAYALVNATKQRVFKSNKLSYGAHTMVVEIADQKNEAASNDTFGAELDYIKVISPAEKVETKNLFNKDDEDVWKNALSYEGNKLSNSSYEKVFATHKIDVKPGDTLSWGNMGIDDYVLEMFKADGSYLGQIKASDIPSENIIKTGKKVLCSGNGLRYEGRLSYTFTSDEISSVRILGNMETIDKMMVFKNLNNQFVDWPTNSYVAYNQVLESTENILTGKSAIFFGDSITDASYKDEDHARWGWAGRVGTYNGMKWTNAAVDGAAISTGWDAYKDNRVIRQLENHKESYDYVILHGGMNDCLKP